MRRSRALKPVPVLVGAVTLTLAACSGGDGEAPSGTTAPSPGGLPPSLVECFADAGFAVESADEIHAAPPEVVERCFEALHQGG